MTAIPSQTLLNSAQNEGALKGELFNPILAILAESIGGAPITELTIASGVITPTAAFHSVDTESSTPSDTLDTLEITNHPEGRLVVLRCENALRAITLKHAAGGTGQMLLRGDADIVLDNLDDFVWLQRVGVSWVEVLRSGPQTETVIDGMDAEDARNALGLKIGTDVEAANNDIVKAPGNVLPALSGANLTDLPTASSAVGVLGGLWTNSQSFTSSGTFTAPATLVGGCVFVKVQAKGGDGGNSGLDTPGSGGGGSSGRYCAAIVPVSPDDNIAVTINSVLSSFGAYVSCAAGLDGINQYGYPGAVPDLPTTADGVMVVETYAEAGTQGNMGNTNNFKLGGLGGSSPLGVGGYGGTGAGDPGDDATGYGSGGGGAVTSASNVFDGGAGSPGKVEVYWNQSD